MTTLPVIKKMPQVETTLRS